MVLSEARLPELFAGAQKRLAASGKLHHHVEMALLFIIAQLLAKLIRTIIVSFSTWVGKYAQPLARVARKQSMQKVNLFALGKVSAVIEVRFGDHTLPVAL